MHQDALHRTIAITPELAGKVVAIAGRAPSLHNTQPWHFRLVLGVIELRIDPKRAMARSDPAARELVISCGAALYALQLALRGEAMTPHVDIAPLSDDPLVLARISVEDGPMPTADESRLLAAVFRRHTHRHGFDGVPLSPAVTSAMEADVASEGARLVWVDDPGAVTSIAELALLADRLQVQDPEWQAEIEGWVHATGSGRRDGIPIASVPLVPPPVRTDRLPDRSFAPGRSPRERSFRSGAAGRVAVLVTSDDLLGDWLSAGQALHRMLLRAADEWAFASFATAPLEIPHLREALRDTLGLRDHPQMVLELGHAGRAHATPRLPSEAQLDLS